MKSKAENSAESSPTSTPYSNPQQPLLKSRDNFKPIQLLGYNNYDTKQASDHATTPPEHYGESMTVQAHAADADINILMERFGVTQKMPDNADEITQAMWGVDFTNNPITDYRSAVEAVTRAHEGFMLFPAEIRARFENDPHRLIEWVNNPANAEEARKFGLVKPKPEEWKPTRDTQAIIDAVKPPVQPKKEDPK